MTRIRAKVTNFECYARAEQHVCVCCIFLYRTRKLRQAESATQLKLATRSMKLGTHLLGLLTQPAVAGAGSLGELQLRIFCPE